jgi:hypothetical protein
LDRMRDGYAGPQRSLTLETRLEVRDSTAPPGRAFTRPTTRSGVGN